MRKQATMFENQQKQPIKDLDSGSCRDLDYLIQNRTYLCVKNQRNEKKKKANNKILSKTIRNIQEKNTESLKLQISQKNPELSETAGGSIDWYKYLGKLVVSIKRKCLANPLISHSKYKLSRSVGLCAPKTCPQQHYV